MTTHTPEPSDPEREAVRLILEERRALLGDVMEAIFDAGAPCRLCWNEAAGLVFAEVRKRIGVAEYERVLEDLEWVVPLLPQERSAGK